MKKKKLKLFVWTDFCSDYYAGLAFAIAYDEEHAMKMVNKNMECTVEPNRFNGDPIILPLSKAVGFGVAGGSG